MQNKLSYPIKYDYCLATFSIITLLFQKQAALAFIIFVVLIVVGAVKKKIIFKFNTINALFVVFYLLYVFYAIYSNHLSDAVKYFEYKLSFLVLPILFFFVPKELPTFKWTKIGFIVAVLLLAFQSTIHSIIDFQHSHEIASFISTRFSFQHHPSYASVFYSFALLIVWNNRKNYTSKNQFYWLIPVSLLFLFAILCCMSLAGLLFLILFLLAAFIHFLSTKIGKKKAFLFTAISPIVFYVLVLIIPPLKSQWDDAKHFTVDFIDNPMTFLSDTTNADNGSSVRLILWTVATQVFKENPLGVGTANVDDYLHTKLTKLKQYTLAEKYYNPHNQYLQSGIEIGVIGLAVLLLLLFKAANLAWKQRNYLLFFVVFNLAFNMLFESMLQRQSGIVFYTFWMCFLVVYSAHFSSTKKEQIA
jgi:O-antigen ligase